MRIYTLTLNPAYDIHATTAHFLPCKENLAAVTSRDAGGKGVNISRALHSGGTENTAVIVLGKENGGEFKESLASFGLNCLYFEKEGRIRENLTLHCETTGETRISFAGFSVTEAVLDQVEAAMDVDENTCITFTGRIPGGISVAAAKAFLARLRDKNAKIVIDCKSFTLEDLFELKPWLIKPNQEEISEYLGREIETFEEVFRAADELYAQGIENVMISLGEKGALLVCAEGGMIATPPVVDVVSTIGAGDSSIGGFLAEAVQGASAEQMLCGAVSYGTAACMAEGTNPPRAEDVIAVRRQIKVTRI